MNPIAIYYDKIACIKIIISDMSCALQTDDELTE